MPPKPLLSEDTFGRMYADVAGLAPQAAWAEVTSPRQHSRPASAAALDLLGGEPPGAAYGPQLLHSHSFSLGDSPLSPNLPACEAMAGLSPRFSLSLAAESSLQTHGGSLRSRPSHSSQLAAQLAHMDVSRAREEPYGAPWEWCNQLVHRIEPADEHLQRTAERVEACVSSQSWQALTKRPALQTWVILSAKRCWKG